VLPETWALNKSRIDAQPTVDAEEERQQLAAVQALIGDQHGDRATEHKPFDARARAAVEALIGLPRR
jgi:hypothetical protein